MVAIVDVAPGLWIWRCQDAAKVTSFASTVPAVRPGAS
jgi:hypothetical protein